MPRAHPSLQLVAASPDPRARPDFSTVFRLNHSWVAGVAARMCGRSGEVDDIVQDVFFLCARKLDTISTIADARPWLRTVTVRLVRKRLRRQKWMAWFRSTDEGLAELPYRGLSPDERSMLEGLYAALGRLPLEERLAWMLRYVEGATLEEVAQGCDCSLATAKRRLTKASKTLVEGGHVAAQA